MNLLNHPLAKGLNPAQHAAVFAPFKNTTLVLAGAGCGKTTVLTRRIAYCAETFCSAKNICALTFTKKASVEMDERIALLLTKSDGLARPTISTFHALCYRIISNTINGISNMQRIGYSSIPILITNKQKMTMLSRISSTADRTLLGVDLTGLDTLISRLRVHPQRMETLNVLHKDCVELLIKRCSAYKKEQNMWDFSDMIHDAITLLKNHKGIAEEYFKRFSCILVDEFQDTNPLQVELLSLIRSASTPLFVVGDDDQAIYGFLGSDPTIIGNIATIFGDTLTIKLEENYRSTPAILACANKIFKDKTPELRKILKPPVHNPKDMPKKLSAKPVFMRCKNDASMYSLLVKALNKLYRNGFTSDSITLLLRTNYQVDSALRKLSEFVDTKKLPSIPNIMTIHAAKGLEWPVVFLCDCEEGGLPYYRLIPPKKITSLKSFFLHFFSKKKELISQENVAEEKRLFYVGVTRAKTVLFFVSSCKKEIYGKPVTTKVSRFIKLVK